MRTVILGGNGYIGAALSDYLAEKQEVVRVDIQGSALSPCLIADYDSLQADFFGNFDNIVLLSGLSSVQMCQRDGSEATLSENILKFIRLVGKLKQQKFVYASTGAVYGSCGPNPACESDRVRTTTLYDWSKKVIDDFASMSNLDYYGLRLGSVFGVSSNMRTDLVLNRCMFDLANGIPASVYGHNVWRPFLNLCDLCEAIQRILVSPSRPGIYNLSSVNMDTKGVCATLARMYPGVEFAIRSDRPCYDFSMSSNKFMSVYDFEFRENIDSYLEDMRLKFAELQDVG